MTTESTLRHNTAVWFELPVADIARATRFYETVLGTRLKPEPQGQRAGAVFPYLQPGVSGALVAYPEKPNDGSGAIVYLDCGEALEPSAARVEPAGGKLLSPRISVPGIGSFFHVLDTEGNRVGLFSAAA